MRLSIISHHPESDGRELYQYPASGIRTVGVFGDEPFGIRFQNTAGRAVQVRFSIDGRDVVTGQPADLDPASGPMFVLGPYGRMQLNTWAGTAESDGRFVFTSPEDTPPARTTDSLGAVGYISTAVFTESYVAPHTRSVNQRVPVGGLPGFDRITRGHTSRTAAGVSERVSQQVGEPRRLIKPRLSQQVQVRHLPWSDLIGELRAAGIQPPRQYPSHLTGLPGESPDLDSRPRRRPVPEPLQPGEFPRFIG